MQIWLKGSGQTLRIPVLPDSYTVTSKQNNTVVNVTALGDINLLGNRGLLEIEWSKFFPKTYDETYCEYRGFPSPAQCVKRIETMKRGGAVKLTITGIPICTEVSIESFKWYEDDGTGDIKYDISIKEHRKVSKPKKKKTAKKSEKDLQRSGKPAAASSKTYTVKKGDCLSTIAKKLTGSSDWKALYQQNKSTVGSNPNLIYPGQKLQIPG